MIRPTPRSSTLLAVIVCAALLPTIAMGQADTDGWQRVAPGIEERTGLDGTAELRARGAEGLSSVLPRLEAELERATDVYFATPTAESWDVVETYSELIRTVERDLARDAKSLGISTQAAGPGCAQSNSFLGAQTTELSCGNQAVATAGFNQAGQCTGCSVYAFARVRRSCSTTETWDVDYAGPSLGSFIPLVANASLSSNYSSCFGEAIAWAYCPGDSSFYQVQTTNGPGTCGYGLSCAVCMQGPGDDAN